MNWMLLPYRRYFDFSGRSRRREFWLFNLFCALVTVAINLVFGATDYEQVGWFISATSTASTAGAILNGVFNLVSLIPALAVSVRRLHDIDRSGWMLLLMLVPVLGWFALLVLNCLDGTRGANRFGPDPKGRHDIDVFG